jgi:hypothetical protein
MISQLQTKRREIARVAASNVYVAIRDNGREHLAVVH